MTWQFYLAVSVLLFSTNSLLHRILMRADKSDPYAQTLAFYGLGGILALAIAIFQGGFHYQIAPNQIPYFVILSIFGTLGPILAFKAYKQIEASEATILFSSHRLWSVFGAFFVLKEAFSWNKVLGTLIILLGIMVAMWRKQKFKFNSGVIFAILASFSYAISDIASFLILQNFDVVSFSVYACFIPVIILLLIKPKTIIKLKYYFEPKRAMAIIMVSANDTLATLAVNYAYQIGRNAAQISPLSATQVIISVILAVIFLKERDFALRKIIGAVIVVGGVLLII